MLTGKTNGDVERGALLLIFRVKGFFIIRYKGDAAKVSSITEFFSDDPNMPYIPLPEHAFDQSPCSSIIGIRQGYFYCKLHPDIKNAH
jgi:hypothetical protein